MLPPVSKEKITETGKVVTTHHWDGIYEEHTYDHDGNLVSWKKSNDYLHEYDKQGNLTYRELPGGCRVMGPNFERWEYDEDGEVTVYDSQIDGVYTVKYYGYDEDGNQFCKDCRVYVGKEETLIYHEENGVVIFEQDK